MIRSWLGQLIINVNTRFQGREMVRFNKLLEGCSDEEIGNLLVGITHFRHTLERQFGVNLLNPLDAYAKEPAIDYLIRSIAIDIRKRNIADSNCVMVWRYSVISVMKTRLLPHGRHMWSLLSRGIEKFNDGLTIQEGHQPNVEIKTLGFDRVPIGLE